MEILFLRGEDVLQQTYWAWEWSNVGNPQFKILQRDQLDIVLKLLDQSLPGFLEEEKKLAGKELADAIEEANLHFHLREDLLEKETVTDNDRRVTLMINRCLTGAFSDIERERRLLSELSELLLPPELISELRKKSEKLSPDGVEVRVLPAPCCARIPWEILPTNNPEDPDERLLDLARVITMAPLLSRDGDEHINHPDWQAHKNEPPLYIIDPSKDLLNKEKAEEWETILSDTKHPDLQGVLGEPGSYGALRKDVNRSWLRNALKIKRSRFIYFGHVIADESTAGKTALWITDLPQVYGLGDVKLRRIQRRRKQRRRLLTAQDLFAGTANKDFMEKRLTEKWNKPRKDAILKEFGQDQPEYPDGAKDSDGNGIEVQGVHLWPMPPRAALIACSSGEDYTHPEPFGLVTAFLELGAEIVTATRWTMLADAAFPGETANPLSDIAFAADQILQDQDPNSALTKWQRQCLRSWRETNAITSSPLSWAALTNYYAPDRTERRKN